MQRANKLLEVLVTKLQERRPLKSLQTYFHVTVKRYILLQHLGKHGSLSVKIYHNTISD